MITCVFTFTIYNQLSWFSRLENLPERSRGGEEAAFYSEKVISHFPSLLIPFLACFTQSPRNSLQYALITGGIAIAMGT